MFWGILYKTIINKPTNTLYNKFIKKSKYLSSFTSFGLSLNRFFPIDHCFTFELRRLSKQKKHDLSQLHDCNHYFFLNYQYHLIRIRKAVDLSDIMLFIMIIVMNIINDKE